MSYLANDVSIVVLHKISTIIRPNGEITIIKYMNPVFMSINNESVGIHFF